MFCSDLDRTLIYSKKFIGKKDIKKSIVVEIYKQEPLSYMSQKSIELLKEINEKNLFIPVTTRTQEQYERIEIFRDEIKSKYAIVENGGRILENSKIDEYWENYIIQEIKNQKTDMNAVLNEFNKIKSDWILKERIVKNKFIYFIIDRKKISEELSEFFKWLKANGWDFSLQARKMYFIPEFINKNTALQYILKKEKVKKYFATGDSFLDLSMVKDASISLVPVHGELKELNLETKLNYTDLTGFGATEEILEKYIECFKKG
ncbi:MAG: hypothetical protein B6I28_03750 [Fusobacteriia bacterium 4572_132]|nr:MAG: hypothetical protein B6I28_03750 [Fusobacteriia bacterium 4572_132]